jgi:hypothetical protein
MTVNVRPHPEHSRERGVSAGRLRISSPIAEAHARAISVDDPVMGDKDRTHRNKAHASKPVVETMAERVARLENIALIGDDARFFCIKT